MQYYSLEELKKKDAKYNVLIGKRDNGKSFAIKEELINNFLNKGEELYYVRRLKEDIKLELIEGYFADVVKDKKGKEWIKKWSKGKYYGIKAYRGSIYFTDVEGNKLDVLGHYGCLSKESRYKSIAYPQVRAFIFEEFITSDYYLVNEPKKLESYISSVLRNGEDCKVYMIGNTLSRQCPYFKYWSLHNVARQKQGTIDVYNFHTVDGEKVKVAVELCDKDTGEKGTLFFGKSGKNIDGGEWDVDEYPQLEEKFEHYECIFVVYYVIDDFSYKICLLRHPDDKLPFIYIYPFTRGDIEEIEDIEHKRIVSDRHLLYDFATPTLHMYKTKYDELIEELIKEDKVRYSDNLTATEFNRIYRG